MVGVISMFVSDAATIAMTIPIGMSLVRHTWTMAGARPARIRTSRHSSRSGPFTRPLPAALRPSWAFRTTPYQFALLEQFTGRQLGFFEWMAVGVPVFLALLAAFYGRLWMLVRPEIRDIPSGEAFLRAEQTKLGPLRSNERRVLLVFAVMILLFTLPTLAALALGEQQALSVWVTRALPIWVVPPAVMFLFFTIRSSEGADSPLLTWKDAEQHGPWSSMFLVGGAVAMTDALTQFGFVEFVGGMIKSLGISLAVLPYLAASVVAVSTNFISGTALYCSVFIPAAAQIGFNPASMAILIGNLAVGLIFPWAGATAATAFAAGEIGIERMIKDRHIVDRHLHRRRRATIHVMLAGFV